MCLLWQILSPTNTHTHTHTHTHRHTTIKESLCWITSRPPFGKNTFISPLSQIQVALVLWEDTLRGLEAWGEVDLLLNECHDAAKRGFGGIFPRSGTHDTPVSLPTQPQELLIRHIFSLIACLFSVPHKYQEIMNVVGCSLLYLFLGFPLAYLSRKSYIVVLFVSLLLTLTRCISASKPFPLDSSGPLSGSETTRRTHSRELDGLLLYLKKKNQKKKNQPTRQFVKKENTWLKQWQRWCARSASADTVVMVSAWAPAALEGPQCWADD